MFAITEEKQQSAAPKIWVLAEYPGGEWPTVVLELLGDAAALTQKAEWRVAVVVFAKPDALTDKDCQTLASHGAGEVHVLENDQFCKPNGPLLYRNTLETFFEDAIPEHLLVPSTALWVECMGVLAAHWNANLVSEVMSFRQKNGEGLEVTRYGWRDKVQMTVALAADRPWCVCLRPNVAGVGKGNKRGQAQVAHCRVDVEEDGRVTIHQLFSPDPSDIDLLEADRIIAGGRGLGDPEGFDLLEKLAKVLGAGVGASRVAVDLGWVPYSRQIGQTGKTVKPRLYIAVGISGASQHVDGMSGSEVIIAINKDPNANIFKTCHIGFVGEAEPIIYALMEALGHPVEASKQVAATEGK